MAAKDSFSKTETKTLPIISDALVLSLLQLPTHGIDSIQIFVVTFLEFNILLTLTILVVPTLKKVKAVELY
jgi:hypothetical protein